DARNKSAQGSTTKTRKHEDTKTRRHEEVNHRVTEAQRPSPLQASAAPPACFAGRIWRRSAVKRKRMAVGCLRFIADSTRIRRFAASAQRWFPLWLCVSVAKHFVSQRPPAGRDDSSSSRRCHPASA